MKKTAFTVIAVIAAAATMISGMSFQFMEQTHATRTTKLIDTSTGEGTEQIARSGAVGETAPAGTLAGLTLPDRKVPIAISEDNIYIVWPSNRTGNDEVNFRASTDGGATFADKINLSNTTNSESQDPEIAADGNNVIVTFWERNQTAEEPVARISSDNGQTFGPLLKLATNGIIGEAAVD